MDGRYAETIMTCDMSFHSNMTYTSSAKKEEGTASAGKLQCNDWPYDLGRFIAFVGFSITMDIYYVTVEYFINIVSVFINS